MENVKVSIVNYLNSTPFVAGLQRAKDLEIELMLDVPAISAQRLLTGEVDVALAPIAIIPQLQQHKIITPYCIGTTGAVKTVIIFSEVPIQEATTIYLDYQSKTSVELTRILCKEHWKINPVLQPAYPGFQKEITEKSAGLVIGDRAIRLLGKYPYAYDLGEEWHKWSGLPFVFAAWIANKPLDAQWIIDFSMALAKGLNDRPALERRYKHMNTDLFSVHDYLNTSISYDLDSAKIKALQQFLRLIAPDFQLNY